MSGADDLLLIHKEALQIDNDRDDTGTNSDGREILRGIGRFGE